MQILSAFIHCLDHTKAKGVDKKNLGENYKSTNTILCNGFANQLFALCKFANVHLYARCANNT